ncbi:uncharacterized protein Z519_09512 [Cladophialophora bantiana CBS 173.52]|uniref:Uncharacterized protein n=1 Tax=Cladophialophora bantiana (strain ATCC 10958 / CBS 173.52 / CDC B-1940 / NIH 8579) TaxID=1442370 RepID=A0A0D2EJ68_CLAB1|nr:uncharacterized protein Z519_09512 [Cladophialophora bantiana CBS 173.52]KIW90081.1 hypothetical protein Z519_09512 [Cladophialophora bantiana CBS 173.52]
MRPAKTTLRIWSGTFGSKTSTSAGLNRCSSSSSPYCVVFSYAHGSVGYGCVEYEGYSPTVLLEPLSTAFVTVTESTSSSSIAGSQTSSVATSGSASKPNGLSDGAIAGIAIGGFAAVAVVCCFVFWLWFNNCKNPRSPHRKSATGLAMSQRKEHISGGAFGTELPTPNPQRFSPDWGFEDSQRDTLVEMPDESGPPYELPTV